MGAGARPGVAGLRGGGDERTRPRTAFHRAGPGRRDRRGNPHRLLETRRRNRRRCGYVALIGAPNVGKSTLLNQLVGRKLAIVTPKVQTTRTRLLGIAIAGPAQLIFVDTPGIFEPRRRLDRAMVAAAWAGAADADAAVLLVDAAHSTRRGVDRDTRHILDRLAPSPTLPR